MDRKELRNILILLFVCFSTLYIVLKAYDFFNQDEEADYYNEEAVKLRIKGYSDSVHNAEKKIADSFSKTPQGIKKRKQEIKDSIIDAKNELKISKVREKYNCTYSEAVSIMKGNVSLGMTKQMCIAAWGSPDDINTSRSYNSYQEQWVYGYESFLYFSREGLLEAIQN